MRKFYLLPVLFIALFSSCSDSETPEAVQQKAPEGQNLQRGVFNCVGNVNLIAPSASAVAPGGAVTFTWNHSIIHAIGYTYNSYIEIDGADTPCVGVYPIASFNTIDFFGTTSYVKSAGVSAACFKWRIVINGTKGFDTCVSETDWQYFHY